jgi:hypothetical protein
LTEKDWKVTFLLRNPSVFDKDEVIKQHIDQGTAKLVKGDALIHDDVKRAWDEAISLDNQPVDLLVFTVGQSQISLKVASNPQYFLQAPCPASP